MSSLHEIASPPADAISCVRFSPDSNFLAVGAWDSNIHVHKRNGDSFEPDRRITCDAPVLDLAWSFDNATIYSVGLDARVVVHYQQGGRTTLSEHGAASNKIAYSREHHLILSTSWDETLHVHDATSGVCVPIKLAAKPFALSITQQRAVVAMAERKIHVYDLQALRTLVEQEGRPFAEGEEQRQPIEAQPWQTRESSLKFMTRDASCMPDGTGFAASSIEGRVGVEWFDEQENKQTYAFKCHRDKTTVTEGEGGDTKPMDIIYPVNAIAFHPVYGSFATGGGDCVVALWDAKSKRRIRQYPKLPASVAALEFSADGKWLAVGVSPGFEDGKEEEEPDPSLLKVYVREMGEGEAKPKVEKAKKDAA